MLKISPMIPASPRAYASVLAICAAFTLAACGANRCDPGQDVVNPACRVPDASQNAHDAGTAGTDGATLPIDGHTESDVADDAAAADVPTTDDGGASPDGSS